MQLGQVTVRKILDVCPFDLCALSLLALIKVLYLLETTKLVSRDQDFVTV